MNRLSRVHERYRRQTTDGQAIAYSEREREFTFAKNAENGSPYAIGPLSVSCLSVCSVDGVLWPIGWTDLQSVHGLCCYGNITRMRNVSQYTPVVACSRSMPSILIIGHVKWAAGKETPTVAALLHATVKVICYR